MKQIISLSLTIYCWTITVGLAENWGQPDSDDKIDATPWIWSLQGENYDTPEAVASAMTSRSGLWAGIFSAFRDKWESFEHVDADVIWKTAEQAIVHGYAEDERTEMCAVWILLRRERDNNQWMPQDALIRRDIGYSHAETQIFEKVKGVSGPILFIDTYRGGRRTGDQSYELYRIEKSRAPQDTGPVFRRCLNLDTLYRQFSWRGYAEFSLSETFEISVEMLRENMRLDEEVRSTIQLNWLPESHQFDSRPMEEFIGLEKLEMEDRKTGEK